MPQDPLASYVQRKFTSPVSQASTGQALQSDGTHYDPALSALREVQAREQMRADVDPEAESRPNIAFDANAITKTRAVRAGAFDPKTGQFNAQKAYKASLADNDELIGATAASITDEQAKNFQNSVRANLAEQSEAPGNMPIFRDLATAKRVMASRKLFPQGMAGPGWDGDIKDATRNRTVGRAIAEAPADFFNAGSNVIRDQIAGAADFARAAISETGDSLIGLASPSLEQEYRKRHEKDRQHFRNSEQQRHEENPSHPGSFAGGAGNVAGNVLPWLGPTGSFKAVMGTLVASSADQGYNTFLDWAKDNGGNPEDPGTARAALGLGVGYGAAEYIGERIGVGYVFERATPKIIGALGKAVMKKDAKAASHIAAELFGAGAVNFLEEGGTQVLQNAIDSSYNDTVNLTDGLLDSGVGGAEQGVVMTLAGMMLDPRARASLRRARREDARTRETMASQPAESAAPAPTVPVSVTAPVKPKGRIGIASDEIRGVANDYLTKNAERLGLEHSSVVDEGEIQFDDSFAKKVGAVYGVIPHAPSEEQVAASYSAFASEIKDQYRHAIEHGYIMKPFESTPEQPQPYTDSTDAAQRIASEKKVLFFTGGEMPQDHPLAQVDSETGLTYNDMFRAIHDFFGHVANGNEFGPRGETAASRDHVKMFSPAARPAMLTETLGQNSWVNYGPHVVRLDGSVPKSGDPDFVPQSQRPFAEQKATLLPQELVDEFLGVKKAKGPLTINDRIASAEQQIAQAKADISRHASEIAGKGGAVTLGTMRLPTELIQPIYNYAEGIAKLAVLHGVKKVGQLKALIAADKSDEAKAARPYMQYILKIAIDVLNGSFPVDQSVDEAGKPSSPGSWIAPDGKLYGVKALKHWETAQQVKDKYGFDKSKDKGVTHEDQWRQPATDAGLVRVVKMGNRLAIQGKHLTPESRAQVAELAKNHIASGLGDVQIDIGENSIYAAKTENPKRVAARVMALPTGRVIDKVPAALPGKRKGMNRPGGTIAVDQVAKAITSAAAGYKKLMRDAVKRGLTSRIAAGLTAKELQGMPERVAAQITKIYNELPPDAEYESAAIAGLAKKGWYERAAVTLRVMFGPEAPRFAALLAAQSPRQSVVGNLKMSLKTWAIWTERGRPTDKASIESILKDTGMGASMASRARNAERVLSIKEMPDLSGYKVTSFHQNLIGNLEEVTNDVWMATLSGVEQDIFGTKQGYLANSAKIRVVANKLGMQPAEVQETTWSFIKTLAEVMATVKSPKEAVKVAMARVHETPEFATLLLDDKEIISELERTGLAGPVRTYLQEQRKVLDEAKAVADKGSKAADPKHLESIARRIPEGNKTRVRIRDSVTEGTGILHGGSLFDEVMMRSGDNEKAARKQIEAAKKAIAAEAAKVAGKGTSVTLGTVHIPYKLAAAVMNYAAGLARLAAAKGITKTAQLAKFVSSHMNGVPDIAKYEHDVFKAVKSILLQGQSKDGYDAERIDKAAKRLERQSRIAILHGERKDIRDAKKAKADAAKQKIEDRVTKLKQRAAVSKQNAVNRVLNAEKIKNEKTYGNPKVGVQTGTRTEKKEFTKTDMLRTVLRRAVRFASDAWRRSRIEKRKTAMGRLKALVKQYQGGGMVSGFPAHTAANLTKAMLPASIRTKYVRMIMNAESDTQVLRVIQAAQREYTIMLGRQLFNRTVDAVKRRNTRRLTDEDFEVVAGLFGKMQPYADMLRKPGKLTPDEVVDAVQQIHSLHNQIVAVIHAELHAQKIRLADKIMATEDAVDDVLGRVDGIDPIKLDRTIDGVVSTPAVKRMWYKMIDMHAAMVSIENGVRGVGSQLLKDLKEGYIKHLGQQRRDFTVLDEAAKAAGFRSYASAKVKISGLLGRASQDFMKVEMTNQKTGKKEVVTISAGEALNIYGWDDDTVALAHKSEDARERYVDDVEGRIDEFDSAEDYNEAMEAALEKADGATSQGWTFKSQDQTSQVYTLTRAQRQRIIDKIDPKYRRLADATKNYANGERSKRVRDEAHKLTGVMPLQVDNYQPRSRFKQARVGHKNIGWASHVRAMLEEAGFLKDRQASTKIPLVIGDFFEDVWELHLDKSSRLLHIGERVRDFSMVMQDEDVHREVGRRLGASIQNKIASTIEDFTGNGDKNSSSIGTFLNWLSQRIQRGLVSINPSSMLKNLAGSTARLLAKMSVEDLSKAVAMAARNGELLDRLIDQSDYLWHRNAGDPTRLFSGTHDTAWHDKAQLKASLRASAKNLVALGVQIGKPAGGSYAGRVVARAGDIDKSVVSILRTVRLYNTMEHAIARVCMAASLIEAKRQMPGKSGTAVARKAIKMAEELVSSTQPSWDADRSSGWQQDIKRDGATAAFVPFPGDPGRVISMIHNAAVDKNNKHGLARTLTAVAVSASLSATADVMLSKQVFQMAGNAIGGGLSHKAKEDIGDQTRARLARVFLQETVGNVVGVNYLVELLTVAKNSGSPLTDNPTLSVTDDMWAGLKNMVDGTKGIVNNAGAPYQQKKSQEKFVSGLTKTFETTTGVYTGLGPIYQRAKGFGEGLGIVKDKGDRR